MKGERSKLYTSANDFYALEGNHVMKLSVSGAIDVCQTAAQHGLLVVRVEGGIWSDPSFEARLDCIWDGANPPISVGDATTNNQAAAAFISEQMSLHGAFILSTAPVTGWPHKRSARNQA